jgi:hypothetical protein
MKFGRLGIADTLTQPQSVALLMEHQFRKPQKSAKFRTDLLVSVFRAEGQLAAYGLPSNLDQRDLSSSLHIRVALVEVDAAGSYSRPFADFSLN